MRLLCIADKVAPVLYSPEVKNYKVDAVLAAGDLDMDYYEYIVTVLGKPLYFVFGNHNLTAWPFFKESNIQEQLAGYGSQCIEDKVINLNKGQLLIAGLGGSKLYNGGLSQYTEGQMLWRIVRLIPRLVFNKIKYGRYLDILLSHAPPYRLGDDIDPCHEGFKIFRWFLKKFKPTYQLHGHIHLDDINLPRVRRYEKSALINCYNYFILEYKTP
ncbi:MAG: metallophosphoesterase [Spirochaetaceae bacterium]|nr:metallophosphoesterase [Spirochaetaceae bacterium]